MKLTAHFEFAVPDNIHPKSIAQLLNFLVEAFRVHRKTAHPYHPSRAYVTGVGVTAFQVNGGEVCRRPSRTTPKGKPQ